MRKFILFVIVVCLTKTSFAQNDFRNGYIISNAGDTVSGLVDYSEGLQIYKSCHFKTANDQNSVTYDPNQILGYGFTGGYFFESKDVNDEKQKLQRVFVEVKVKGMVSLYRYDYSYFVEKNNGNLQRLSNGTHKVYVNGKPMMQPTNQHISTLNILLSDCIQLKKRIQNIRLVEKQLTPLIEDYNHCMGDASVTYNVNKPRLKVLAGITGGLNTSKIKFENATGVYDYLGGSFDVSNSPIIGLTMDIFAPRVSERFSVHTDILYSKSTYDKFTSTTGLYVTERNYITIELQQLKIPVGLRYTFPEKKFTPYLNLGMSATLNLSSSNPLVKEVELANRVEKFYEESAFKTQSNQLGFWGGLGVSKSINKKANIFAELRYEHTDGIVDSSVQPQGLNSTIKNLQITFGIRTR